MASTSPATLLACSASGHWRAFDASVRPVKRFKASTALSLTLCVCWHDRPQRFAATQAGSGECA